LRRYLSKDFLSGVMFIAFGLVALWFGRHLALGTSVRMGPGYVPHMLADIMIVLGTIISLLPLYANASTREKETIWAPVGGAAVVLILAIRFVLPLPASLAPLASDWLLLVATVGVFVLLLICVLVNMSRGSHVAPSEKIDTVEPPKWRPITMVTIGIVVFALLFETTGMFPSLVALVLIASLGGDEFKLLEVIGNIVVLTILCVAVFKIGLSMNIAVINGVW
jgi:Tripartite tricarboxylate transporter TctB family